MAEWNEAVAQICDMAAHFGSRGWLMATCGNLSVKVADRPLQLAITRSGVDKQHLRPDDVLCVDADLRVYNHDTYRPSAETLVHVGLYQRFQCGSVVHVHSIYNNLASDIFWPQRGVHLADYEFLKALGHWEKNAAVVVPIVENFHDLQQLAEAVEQAAQAGVPGVLVRNHGIYAWGDTAADAKRHLEAFEFLFELHVRRLQLAGARTST